jgi:hypothetical protein
MLIMVINHTQTVSMIKEIQTATVLLGNYCYKQYSSSRKDWMELPKYDKGTYVHSR